MRRELTVLVGSATLVLTAALTALSNANSSAASTPNTREVLETQRLNSDALWQRERYHGRNIHRVALSGDTRAKYVDEKSTSPVTGKVSGVKRSRADRIASHVGNEIMRAMYTKRAPFTDRELAVGLPLNEVGKPTQTLSTAPVETRDGWVLGDVKVVKTNSMGAPKAIDITAGGFLGVGERVVPIRAKDMIYLQDRNVLVTNMSKDQVSALPAIKSNT